MAVLLAYYFKLYHITTLVAKCQIYSFRLRRTGSPCHMFSLNVEFGNSFGFSSVTFQPSRVFHSRVFSRPGVDTDEQSTSSCPHLYQTFKMLWQILRADNVFVRFYFATL